MSALPGGLLLGTLSRVEHGRVTKEVTGGRGRLADKVTGSGGVDNVTGTGR